MAAPATSPSAAIRARLDHPVIDSDGHMVEFLAPIEDYVKAIGGSKFAVSFPRAVQRMVGESNEERRRRGGVCPPWWNLPAKNSLDRATAALPKLMYERLDEMGIDFVVLFSTTGLGLRVYRQGSSSIDSRLDPEVQRIADRAINTYRFDICREYADRMTPVAAIPMHTPEGAIEDLEYAVNVLGAKAVSFASVLRPVAALQEKYPDLFGPRSQFSALGCRVDTFGIDSEYDYDPFWAKCVELKVPVMDHGGSLGWADRNSPSNHMYNTIGMFANGHEAVCKSLFMGGVTRRFPTLKFAFLEGGVSWACRLYADLVGRWKKRNGEAIHNYDPANLDRELFLKLHAEYGDEVIKGKLDRLFDVTPGIEPESIPEEMIDEWWPCKISRVEDFLDLFVRNFYFGCEGDDPSNALAFQSKLWPLNARLKAMFSSDIGHWDVPDMREVLSETYEIVEHGHITEEDFRDFAFSNPVDLFAGMNPDFFKGTVVENEVEALLAERPAR